MAEKIYFTERQRFNQWWLWLILLISFALPFYGIYEQLQSPEPFSDPEKTTGIILTAIIMLPVMALFLFMRLETQIKEDGIYVRFFPFHLKFRHFPWSETAEAYVRQYSAISEYGGWGLRFGIFGSGKAYNVSGNQGIQLVFKTGKKLLIGTNKPAEAARVLKEVAPVNA
ncbi:MAG TPA: hypothetical protein VK927_00790 [Adhaeribacter sp.]|nr:hypothetical protein [Adhaeribacter sp.]